MAVGIVHNGRSLNVKGFLEDPVGSEVAIHGHTVSIRWVDILICEEILWFSGHYKRCRTFGILNFTSEH